MAPYPKTRDLDIMSRPDPTCDYWAICVTTLMEVFNDFGKHDPEESRDLDFSDVFGGPPRRFLMQDARLKYSFDEKVGLEEDGGSLLWAPMKEKAVFGEERVGGRRDHNDDFYDDIFRGNASYGSLKSSYHDQYNLFGSSPGSRIMSPARALPLGTEPFGASLPAQFRFSNPGIGKQEEIKHYIQPAHHQSPISQNLQYNAEKLKKEAKSINSNCDKFHFSIYKWAGKGVPMIRSLVSRNSFMSKDDRRFETAMKIECDKKDSRSEEGMKELDRYCVEKAVFGVSDSKFYHDGEENVAFEVNSLPEFHGDKVEQQENIATVKENETIIPKEEAHSDAGKNVENNEGIAKNMIQDNQVDEAQESSHTKSPIYRSDNFSTSHKAKYSSEIMDNYPNYQNYKNFSYDYVQELSDDVEEVTESGEASEDIKALGAKIRQWSSGKKGNIRSLLSTLQYVFWPGSGWKPIPLVDLIEGNSVKRAYQKALLHLHPDKLQQKGAPSQHKYIAEKVFDILQEAWDHFNTLAPL
ncbi:hypothetical protein CDL12_14921 [Handroanthus impetiginosus]|uniref:J domain-containing protein n=1 Tax=Handroanthus impetiginosus TaxID=429701 RepID=A0A2G9H4M7_9LAMI|nr:hypothetical protein CDL12_14921 [Handroanthus impetiginosus]